MKYNILLKCLDRMQRNDIFWHVFASPEEWTHVYNRRITGGWLNFILLEVWFAPSTSKEDISDSLNFVLRAASHFDKTVRSVNPNGTENIDFSRITYKITRDDQLVASGEAAGGLDALA